MKGTGKYKYFYIMNKDIHLMFEAYQQHLLERKEHCSSAARGCDCDGCEECKENASMEGVMSGYGKSGEISAEQEDAEGSVSLKTAEDLVKLIHRMSFGRATEPKITSDGTADFNIDMIDYDVHITVTAHKAAEKIAGAAKAKAL
jgi:hypothetical protein